MTTMMTLTMTLMMMTTMLLLTLTLMKMTTMMTLTLMTMTTMLLLTMATMLMLTMRMTSMMMTTMMLLTMTMVMLMMMLTMMLTITMTLTIVTMTVLMMTMTTMLLTTIPACSPVSAVPGPSGSRRRVPQGRASGRQLHRRGQGDLRVQPAVQHVATDHHLSGRRHLDTPWLCLHRWGMGGTRILGPHIRTVIMHMLALTHAHLRVQS